ncbi:MAG TPA: M23 family metallopeptidase [Flavisolibacter sp.]|nr:M23 family metallopeptidase [Flavisolibacter sp.]
MKLLYFVLLLIPAGNAAAQLTDSEILNLKSGLKKDDSSYVYSLPFVRGKSYLLVQGANSKMSHRNELSYDFKMKKGSKICAARGGVVIDARSDSDKGGLKKENLSDGNYIIVQHDDQSKAYYWHLQKDGVLVKAGDVVQKGQLIGYSGNTGYTAFPHLHFQVTDAFGKEILVRFQSQKGIRYLRPAKWYRKP